MPGCDPESGSPPYPFPEGVVHRMLAVPGCRLHLAGAPGDAARPALFLIPGYTDHLGRYAETFSHFLGAGFAVWGMDLRGHGLSGGPRGYVRRFSVYLDDLAAALGAAAESRPGGRWVLMGHSTGGLVALAALLERRAQDPFRAVAGAILTCPLLRIGRRVSPLLRLAGWAGSRLLPRLSLPAAPDYANSHDPEAERGRREDPLIFRTVNARWYTEALRTAARVARRAEALDLPVLGLQAGQDRAVDPAAAREFFARCPRGTYVEYPDMYHELLLETERARVWADMEAWLKGR